MAQVETRLPYKVADISLAEWGRKEIMLAENEMPGLMALRQKYGNSKPLAGSTDCRLPAHDHSDGGADRDADRAGRPSHLEQLQHLLDPGPRGRRHRQGAACRSTPGKARPTEEFDWCIEQTLFFPDGQPLNMILDDGGDLTAMVHRQLSRAAGRHPRPLGRDHHRRAPALPDALPRAS